MCNESNKRIAKLMDERGLKPFPFSKEIGVPSSTMTSIYKGNVKFDGITIGNFLKIAHGLGMTAEELYYGESYERAARPALSAHDRRMLDAYHIASKQIRRTIDHAVEDVFEDMEEAAKNKERGA